MHRTVPYPPPTIRGRGRGRGILSARGRSLRGVHTSTRSVQSTPTPAFSQTLQFITSIKLQELEKQRLAYEAHSSVLEEAKAAGDNLPLKVEILLKAIRSWSGSGALDATNVIGAKLDLSNLDMWLVQARKDPNFSSTVLKGWMDTLEGHIHHSLTRFECAKLFGNLFNEWLSSGDSVTSAKLFEASIDDEKTDRAEEIATVGREEMQRQKERLNSIIFEPKFVDTGALQDYLSELFADEAGFMRHEIEDFGIAFQRKAITTVEVQWSIKGLLASDLMDEEKRTTLREITENHTVLLEVASVLNMRMSSLGTWSWPATGVVIEMRRHLNGKYRAFTDPEILDAIFLQYIGISWQVKFKQVFLKVFKGQAWKRPFAPLSKPEADRRKFFLNEGGLPDGIESYRDELRGNQFFVGQLASNMDWTYIYSEDAPTVGSSNVNSATAIKQQLLHIMATESHLNLALHGQHTILRTDLEWFGPSLAHNSIITLLSFFGVSQQWLDFFEAFLRAPLRFKEEPTAELRTRQCGTPISYALSALCGEVILFAMDFAVNQRADGLFLYRIHDDLWLWDSDSDKCVAGWREMKKYASLVGLTFNAGKTGSTCVGNALNPELPPGDIRWGFLKFEPGHARFVIDQEDVDKHIVELRRQLAATKSVFGWVNAYNKYMAFFVRNFGGRPATCFGRTHVDDIIDTLARIQRELFRDTEGGGAVGHLQSVIEERFGVRDLPQGYFYFPIGSGGMDIRNPMIELLSMRETVDAEPERAFIKEIERDGRMYYHLKAKWESAPASSTIPIYNPSGPLVEFMPYSEYISQRETRLRDWRNLYAELLKTPEPVGVALTPAVDMAIRGTWGSPQGWYSMDYYDQWAISLYGEEVIEKFGSLEVVDPTLIPVGMVQLFRSSRMKWDQ